MTSNWLCKADPGAPWGGQPFFHSATREQPDDGNRPLPWVSATVSRGRVAVGPAGSLPALRHDVHVGTVGGRDGAGRRGCAGYRVPSSDTPFTPRPNAGRTSRQFSAAGGSRNRSDGGAQKAWPLCDPPDAWRGRHGNRLPGPRPAPGPAGCTQGASGRVGPRRRAAETLLARSPFGGEAAPRQRSDCSRRRCGERHGVHRHGICRWRFAGQSDRTGAADALAGGNPCDPRRRGGTGGGP